jgi:hypothetical protein
MLRPIPALVASALAAGLLLACGDARPSARGAHGPLDTIADSLVGGRAALLPCEPIDSARQAALAVAGRRPVESCAFRAGNIATVLLRSDDSTVVSIVRVLQSEAGAATGMSGQEAAYRALAERLDATWGTSTSCPENSSRGVAGDRVWSRDDAHVRLFKRGPAELVLNYELGPGSCRSAS